MKKLFFFFSMLVLIGVVYLIIMNTGNSVDVNYLKGYSYTVDMTRTLKVSSYTAIILLAGIISGLGIMSLFLGIQKDKVKAYKRELEKTSISGETNASRVEVLEAKIKTLEKAFNTVIDERTKLEVQIKSLNAEIEALNKD